MPGFEGIKVSPYLFDKVLRRVGDHANAVRLINEECKGEVIPEFHAQVVDRRTKAAAADLRLVKKLHPDRLDEDIIQQLDLKLTYFLPPADE